MKRSAIQYTNDFNSLAKVAVSISFWIWSLYSYGQEFSITKVELGQDMITLHYELLDTAKNHTYSIHVYTSKDNFLAPLQKVSGDIGLQVKPGPKRKITWHMKEELGAEFNGDISLEVRGRVYIPFLRLEKFKDVIKRHHAFLVKWHGGSRQNILNFELYDAAGKLAHTFPNAPNNSEYKIVIPSSVRPGKNYYFRISDTKNKDQVIETQRFKVKRKYPLVAKAALVLITGGLIYHFSGDDDADPKVSPPPDHP